ncbi:ABC transporter permease subunit [Natrialba asiatica]|uniref:Copper ABC transporter permease n=1 Tax=Natrialba asiatica (strain ATCC 700177 / DSM 12278 / JCM 9576 / FERM P-10747 / NBRC 102637 / 172P1) TaxID=29540 RepID=M0AL34_NATA1|nr:ABC transporter permease subunit [Natrialba asiatica]ELY99435.1 copper ABC transporter permease [Natrialba asiatica DSM 12278]
MNRKNVLSIAKHDFEQLIRSKIVWLGIVVLTVYLVYEWHTSSQHLIGSAWSIMIDPFVIMSPLYAIGLGYTAIAGERASGRIRLSLGAGLTRPELVAGKLLSRFVTLVSVLWLPVVIAAVIVTVGWQPTEATAVGFLGAMVVVTVTSTAWLGIALGASCSASTQLRSIAIGGFLVFLFLYAWQSILELLMFVQTGSTDLGIDITTGLVDIFDPAWFPYAVRVNPVNAFEATQWYVPNLLEALAAGETIDAAHGPNLFGLAMLLVWGTVPIAIGYYRFIHAELE